MTHLNTPKICSMTELREPQKVFDKAGGKPVAILKNSALVGYLVPVEAVTNVEQAGHRQATMEELRAYLDASRERVQPVLDYLRDK
jgi:antitoxin StbD